MEDPQILGVTVHNFGDPGNLAPRICAPLLNTIGKLRAVEREGSEQYLNQV
jgi:hypothetical protein